MIKGVDELKTLCSLICAVIRMSVLCIEDDGSIIFELPENPLRNPIEDLRENIADITLANEIAEHPKTISSKYLENFLIVRVRKIDKKPGYLIYGPSITHVSEILIDLLANMELTPKNLMDLKKYYEMLPIINNHDLLKLGILVHYTLYKEKLDFDSINTISSTLSNVHNSFENEYNIQYRTFNYLRRSSFFERNFYGLIKNGEVEKLKQLLKVHSLNGEYIVLSKNSPLRSWKNLIICFITIACRAAMEGGLPTLTTYAISDVYIQRLEELSRIKDVEDFGKGVFIDLATRVRDLKSKQYSKLITLCLGYIWENLDKKIGLSTASKYLNINGSYLSDLFIKEVGIPISQYILQQRIGEAKRMLLFTQLSILEIYTSLGFCDQSHFTKSFKKITGLTPKQFKNEHSSSTVWY